MLKYLRCPETKSELKELNAEQIALLNQSIEQKQLFNRVGQVVDEKVEGGLINVSNTWIYLVRDGIVGLIQDNAVPGKSLEPKS